MMTPKQALRKFNQTADPADVIEFSEGRGRLSRKAVDKCMELSGKGWHIAGYVVQAAAPAVKGSPTSTVAPVVKKVPVAAVTPVQDFVILHPENMFQAIGPKKKVYGMREACNNCGVSLVQCNCASPTILGHIRVSIEPRTF